MHDCCALVSCCARVVVTRRTAPPRTASRTNRNWTDRIGSKSAPSARPPCRRPLHPPRHDAMQDGERDLKHGQSRCLSTNDRRRRGSRSTRLRAPATPRAQSRLRGWRASRGGGFGLVIAARIGANSSSTRPARSVRGGATCRDGSDGRARPVARASALVSVKRRRSWSCCSTPRRPGPRRATARNRSATAPHRA